MDLLLDTLGRIDGWVLHVLLGVLVFGESAALVALFLPGEIALLVAGALVAEGRVSLVTVLAVAIVAAIAGHAAGYWLGRRYGLQLMTWRPLRRYASAADGAAALVARRGATAVFLGRWTNVTRIVVPLLVGAGRMPYARFTVFNVLGGLIWAVTFVLLGNAAGASLHVLERTVGNASWWASGVVVVAVVARWLWRRRQAAGTAAAPEALLVAPRPTPPHPPRGEGPGAVLCHSSGPEWDRS